MQSQSNPIGALKEAIDREGLNYCLAVHKQFVAVGPPHLPRFTCTLTYGQHAVQSAEHAQKKMAEHDAAERLLVAMQQAEQAATEAKAAAAKKAADEKSASGKAARPYYDNTDHAAEPVRLQWLNRHGDASIRWVFLRCCAQIGTEGADGVVRSQLRCDNAVPVDARGHGGKLLLDPRNSSKTQARRCGGDLAHWSCCGARALSAWEAAWDGAGRVALRCLAVNKCAAGVDAPLERPLDISMEANDTCLDATPIDSGNAIGCHPYTPAATMRAGDASASLALVAVPLHPLFRFPATLPRPVPARTEAKAADEKAVAEASAAAKKAAADEKAAAEADEKAADEKAAAEQAATEPKEAAAKKAADEKAASGKAAQPFLPSFTWGETLRAHLRFSAAATGAAALVSANVAAPPILPVLHTAAPPTPSRAVEGVLREIFDLSLLEGASALWPRGVGGDGSCELLAARGDRLLEWVVVQQLPPSLRAECDVATHTVKYTSNAALAAAARVLKLNTELRIRAGGREPSEHELGTVVEALLMAAYNVKGSTDVASSAVRKLMAIIDDALPLAPLRATAGAVLSFDSARSAGSAVELLMRHVLQLGLSLPLFEVEASRDCDGNASYRVRIIAVEHSVFGEHDVILAIGPWKSSRGESRECAAASLLQAQTQCDI